MGDEELAKRIYNAYDALSPSEDAQERVLSALRAHGHKQETAGDGQALWKRRARWLLVLPAAACLAAMVLVVARPQQSAAPTQMDAVAKTEAPARDEITVTSMEDAESYEAPSLAQEYPIVVLSQGLTLGVGNKAAGPEDEGGATQAMASTKDGLHEVPCWVVYGPGGYWVRYEGEDAWYEAIPVDE